MSSMSGYRPPGTNPFENDTHDDAQNGLSAKTSRKVPILWWILLSACMVTTMGGTAMTAYLVHVVTIFHKETQIKLIVAKDGFTDMKDGMAKMEDEFDLIQKEWRKVTDVTREFALLRHDLDGVKSNLEEMLNLDDKFERMDALVRNMSDLSRRLSNMMRLNQGLMDTAEELKNTRNVLKTTNLKLNEIETINVKLDSLSKESEKIEGIRNALEQFHNNSETVKEAIFKMRRQVFHAGSLPSGNGVQRNLAKNGLLAFCATVVYIRIT